MMYKRPRDEVKTILLLYVAVAGMVLVAFLGVAAKKYLSDGSISRVNTPSSIYPYYQLNETE